MESRDLGMERRAGAEGGAAAEEVVDRKSEGRFELIVDGHVSQLVYEIANNMLILIHTSVPDELAGRGIGGRLVRAAIDRAARDGLIIVPLCPFARRWLQDHPDETGDVAIDF
jgi:predicted GNAT family acetyltransferase